MRMHRQARRRVATWMIGVLLATQWLVAAHACPVSAVGLNPPAGESTLARATGLDCHSATAAAVEAGSTSLCKAHCDADQQVPAQWAPDDALSTSSGWFIVPTLSALEVTSGQTGAVAAPHSRAPPGWPPLYLIHGVLRN